MKVVLDAGAFIAIEKRDRRIGAMLRVLQSRRVPLRTSSTVVAQVWRDGRKQANLARVLAGVEVKSLAPDDDKRTGELQAAAKSSDIVDAHVALLVDITNTLITSDRKDMEPLLAIRKVTATIVDV